MFDAYRAQQVTAEYGDKFERAYDFSEAYDAFHTSLNYYRVYNTDEQTIVIRMSGKNILISEEQIISGALNAGEYRPLTAEERQIYEEQQFGSKVR